MIDPLYGSTAATVVAVFGLGLLVGSFLNVVILRLPPVLEWQWKRDARDILGQEQPYEPAPPGLVIERSACPVCHTQLHWYENVPLLSFMVLRGKCRHCGTAISWQYPIVELLTGLAFVACVFRFGTGPEGLGAITFTSFLIALSGIDWRTTLLPDDLTFPLLWLGLLLSLATRFVDPKSAVVGAAVGYLSLWGVYHAFKLLTGKEGMGYGDFKLLAALGAWCGVEGILPIVLLSSLVGAVIGGGAMLIQGRDRATPIPFGPYLAIAGWIWLLYGDAIMARYWAVMLPNGG